MLNIFELVPLICEGEIDIVTDYCDSNNNLLPLVLFYQYPYRLSDSVDARIYETWPITPEELSKSSSYLASTSGTALYSQPCSLSGDYSISFSRGDMNAWHGV